MSWRQWLAQRNVHPHTPGKQELDGLRALIGRDLADAALLALSADRRFATAYNAALQTAKWPLSAQGTGSPRFPGTIGRILTTPDRPDLLCAQCLDAPVEPFGLVCKAQGAIHPLERLVAFERVKPNAPVKLPQADRAEVQRAPIALGQVIGAVHQAMEIDAVRQAEQVAGLVRQYLATPAQHERLLAARVRLAVEGWIVTRETVNADPLAQGRLAKDKVPRRLGVEVLHGDRQDAEGVGGEAALEKLEHVAGQKLRVLRVRVATS
jgi:hypothetical protein